MDYRDSNFLSFVCALSAGLLLISNCFLVSCLFFLCATYFFLQISGPAKTQAPDDFNVMIIGCGISGICMGHKLNQKGIKYTILEKSSSLGGTWYDNSYPGVACDVPSHLYSFSFFRNPFWSRAYSPGSEILRYTEDVASRLGVYPHIQFGKRVEKVVWNDKTKTWIISTTDGCSYTANVLVSGSGALHVPKEINFPGVEKFKGMKAHTALWDKTTDLTGKRVAVIGTGASAVQTVPSVAAMDLKSLTVYQRTPGWVPPRFDFVYPEYVKKMFAYLPFTNIIYRWFFFLRNEFRYYVLMKRDTLLYKLLGNRVHDMMRHHVRKTVKDQDLAEKLIPTYGMGCKRITPSDTYLEAFNKKFVTLDTNKIETFTETGIQTADGTHKEYDVVIFAIGFDLEKSVKAYQMLGKSGKLLQDSLGDAPSAHYGITHPDMPNFFWLLGPGTGLAHNSIIYMIECQANYSVDCIMTMLKKNAKSMVLKQGKLEEYWNWSQSKMKNKVFADNSQCVGWYRNAKGVNWTLWPLDLISYWWQTISCDQDSYDFNY